MHMLYSLLMVFLLLAGSSIVVDGCSVRFDAKPEGELDLFVTDAPAEQVSQVRVTLSRVELEEDDGSLQELDLDNTEISNLLALRGEDAEHILRRAVIPAGRYRSLRIYFSDQTGANRVIELAGGEFPLLFASQSSGAGSEGFLEISTDFDIPEDGRRRLTLDIDLLRGLTKPEPGFYRLIPVLRLVDNDQSGSFFGDVEATLINADDCDNDNAADEGRGRGNLVYVYEGHDQTVGDIHIDQNGDPLNDNNPLTVAPVRRAVGDSLWQYEVGFLPAGDYTLAFTCQGLSEAPLTLQALRFDRTLNASVSSGGRVRRNITE